MSSIGCGLCHIGDGNVKPEIQNTRETQLHHDHDRAYKNGVVVAKMAENLGIQALAVHGRTRADKYVGDAVMLEKHSVTRSNVFKTTYG